MTVRTARHESGRARLTFDAFLSLVGAILARGAVLALQVGIARLLGVNDFSFFVTASVIGALVHAVSDLGLSQAAILVARGDPSTCRAALHDLHARRILVAGVAQVVGFVSLGGIAGFENMTNALAGWLLLSVYTLQSLSLYYRSPLIAASRVSAETKLMVVERGVAVFGGVVGLLTRDLLWVAIGQLTGTVVGLALSGRVMGRTARLRVLWNRSVLRFGVLMSAAVGATLLYARLDFLILTHIATARVSAVYAAAYTVIMTASMLPIALARSALAHLPSADSNIRSRDYLGIALGLGIIGGFMIMIAGPWVVNLLFGFEHPDLRRLFLLLGPAFVLISCNSTIMVLAGISGREAHLLKVVGSAAVINLSLSLLLIPRYEMIGGGIATLVTEGWVLILWVFSKFSGSSTRSQPLEIEIMQHRRNPAGFA